MANQKPEAFFQHGACRASIFINTVKKDGKTFEIPKVNIGRRYKDSAGSWKGSPSLDVNDVPKMILALSKAYSQLTESSVGKQNIVEEEEVEE